MYNRELLAIKLALNLFRLIMESFLANLFHVATDHKPLTSGKKFAPGDTTEAQLNCVTMTWQLIFEFTIDIRYLLSIDNTITNAFSCNLSCFPCGQEQSASLHLF